MYQLAAAPQSIAGVLDAGFKLFQASFTRVIVLALLAALISVVAGVSGQLLTPQQPGGGALAGFLLGLLVFVFFLLTLHAAILLRIDAVAHGNEMPLTAALQGGLRAGPRFFVAYFLYFLAVVGGLVGLIIPGIIFAVWLIFGPYVAVTDGRGIIASLKYSRAIVRGHWWRTAAVLTIITLIILLLYIVIGFIIGIVVVTGEQDAGTAATWYELVLNPLVSAVVTPLGYALFLACLYDLKLRHEGGDIAERIAAA